MARQVVNVSLVTEVFGEVNCTFATQLVRANWSRIQAYRL